MSLECAFLVVALAPLAPLTPQESRPTAGVPGQTPIADRIASMRKEIKSANLKQTVHDLVGFGTRQVLSATDDEQRGTGAARNYLEARMKSFVARSGGRLSVKREVYHQPSTRLGQNIKLVNIVATLEGTTDPDRFRQRSTRRNDQGSNRRRRR